MSWVEAAWTVKRLQEDLDLVSSLGSFIEQINDLNEEVTSIRENYQQLGEIETPSQLNGRIDNIESTITNTQATLATIYDNGQAFFDRAIYDENEILQRPVDSNHINPPILKNTVWFIIDGNDQSIEQENQNE